MRSRAIAFTVLAVATGCSGSSVPDAFASGVHHGRLLFDRVDCDPSPDTCTRYVVIGPAGTSTSALLAAVTRKAEKALHWAPTHAPEVVENDEGHGFDGPGKTGGYINTAVAELHYWTRVGYASGSPPNKTLRRVEDLMRAHPDAIVVRIDG
jgi:hypothetical protein